MSASLPAPGRPDAERRARHGHPLPFPLVAIVWAVPVLAVAALGVIALLPFDDPYGDPFILPLFTWIVASCGLVGAFLATRLPRNGVGWILWGFALATATSMVAQAYAFASLRQHDAALPGTAVAAWYAGIPISPALATMLLFLPVLFPDGRPPSRRWRPVLVLFAVAVAIVGFPPLFQTGPIQGMESLTNPFGLATLDPLIQATRTLGDVMAPLLLPLALAAPVVRYRGGSSVERQQLKWFGFSAGLAAAGLIAAVMLPDPYGVMGWIACMVALGLVPIAISIAIFRFRLYEIDRIVSRTVSYALVTALLAATFVGTNLGLQAAVADAVGGSTLTVAVSTLVVAALFQPVRRAIQRPIDRRFNRAGADAQRVVEALSVMVRDEVDLGRLRESVVVTATEAVHPAGAALWLRRPA